MAIMRFDILFASHIHVYVAAKSKVYCVGSREFYVYAFQSMNWTKAGPDGVEAVGPGVTNPVD